MRDGLVGGGWATCIGRAMNSSRLLHHQTDGRKVLGAAPWAQPTMMLAVVMLPSAKRWMW